MIKRVTTYGTALRPDGRWGILAHGVPGGWDIRHEGCAPKCCEAEAEPVGETRVAQLARDGAFILCDGCGHAVDEPPAPMKFDRDAKCEAHAEEWSPR